MANHKKRFELWRNKAPKNTAYLINQVLERVIPKFEEKGFIWNANYASGDNAQIGANEIPLQKQSEPEWPTVHIRFHKCYSPWFDIYFSELPLICKRLTTSGYVDIDREKAIVIEGPAYFSLRKGKYSDNRDGEFGYSGPLVLISSPFSLFSHIQYMVSAERFLGTQVDEVLSLLPELFDLFDNGIPKTWTTKGTSMDKVSKHVMLM